MSAAFRDTLIVAVVGVAGVAAMVVWSGGDPPTSAIDAEGTDLTLPSDFTLPPGFSLPEVTVGSAPAVAGVAVIAALPVPSGATETPTGTTDHRFWSFTPGVSWEVVRDEYLAVLRGQGYVADLAQSRTRLDSSARCTR